jgi:hypothetical protein
MADVYSAAFYGEAAKLQALIDRGGDVNYKTVRRRLAARPPRPPRRRARALFGRRNQLLQPAVPAARPALSASRPRCPPPSLPSARPPLFAKVDAKIVRAHRAPSFERVPAAPPPFPPSRSLPPCYSCRRRVPSRGVWADPQDTGATPLHAASHNGHEATVKTLLAAKAQVDAKRVSAHGAPSLERVPAAPPPPPSLPLPSPLAPPAADGSPLVGSGPIRRRTDRPLSTLPHRTGTRRPSRRSSPPRRTWTPRLCAPTARPASSASLARRPPSLLPRQLPPLFLLPMTGPLSWGLGRSAGWRSDPSPHRLTSRARGDRQDAPRRQGASGRQGGERPRRAQPRARPGRAASPPLPPAPLPPCSSCRRRVPSRGVWADPQADGATPLYFASLNGHEATVKTLLAAKAQVDAKIVRAHRAPCLERVPAAPPPSLPPAMPPPLLLLPPTGPLSWVLGRSAGGRMHPSHGCGQPRQADGREDAPRRRSGPDDPRQ